MGNDFRQTAAEQSQEEYFVHVCEAAPDILCECEDSQVAISDTDDTCTENTNDQCQEYIHTGDRQYQYSDVRDNFHDVEGQITDFRYCFGSADHQQDNSRKDSSGQSDQEVYAELIFQFAALCTSCRNGCIGDHGQVVTKQTAAYAGAYHQRQGKTDFFCNTDSQRNDGADCTNGCACCSTHESGNDEDTCYQILGRHHTQTKIYCGISAAHCSCNGCESTCQNVDHQHGEYIFVCCTPCEDGKFFVDAFFPHAECGQNSQEHCCYRGELIECHFYTLMLQEQTCTQIDHDENEEWH